MKKLILPLVMLAAVALTGCSTSLMSKVEAPTQVSVEKNTSRVVFARSSFVGNPIDASLFDIQGKNDPKFIGIMANETQIAYVTEPGEHVFMLVSPRNVRFMAAKLLPGDSYTTVVRVAPGLMAPNIFMVPADKSDKEGFTKLQWVENTPASLKWAADERKGILEKFQENYPKWLEKPEKDRLKDALTVSDSNL